MKYPNLHKAAHFAASMHHSQDRKYTGVPYLVHPLRVMSLVQTVGHDEDMLVAAVLHDVVEDTSATIDDVATDFGNRAADLVGWLTDISKPEDGNRSERKEMDRQHTANAPPEAKTIKLADLIDNTRSIAKHDPDFAKVYMKEKGLLLQVLREGDAYLYGQAFGMLAYWEDDQLQEALK